MSQPGGGGTTLAAGVIRALLWLYPPRFRRRFEAEMMEAFRERWEGRRAEGLGRAWVLVLRTVADTGTNAVQEWLRPTYVPAIAGGGKRSESRGMAMFDVAAQDLRFAVRSLVRQPAFAVVAIATLALGIGANTAIFSVVNGVLLRPLPYPTPGRLLMVWAYDLQDPSGRSSMSQPDIESVRELPGVAAAEGYSASSIALTGQGDPQLVQVARVTGGLLAPFGLAPVLGRDLRHAENSLGAARVVLVGYDFWQTRLGGRRDVIGKTLELAERTYEIVGVAPAGFDFPEKAQLWIPYRIDPAGCGRGCHVFRAIARLAPGMPLPAASAALRREAANLAATYPETNYGEGLRFEPLRDYLVGGVRNGLWILLGAVAVVLLIACANVANLLLVRATARRGEVAIRAALGASRARLLSQLLVESLALGVVGAGLGVGLAALGVSLLKRLTPGTIPRIDGVTINGTVLLVAAGTAVLVAFLFGLSPALQLARTPLAEAMGSGARAGRWQREGRSRSLLLTAEVGLSLVLLLGAGLLLRSLGRLYRVDMGFDGRQVVRFSLNLPSSRYDTLSTIGPFYQNLEDRLANLPGVAAVGSVFGAPLGRGGIGGDVTVVGRPEPKPGESKGAAIRPATPGYFRTMGMVVLRGRGLEPTDRGGTLPVAVVNETFVHEVFPGEDPLGKRIHVSANFGLADPTWTIVGIVRDVRRNPRQDPPAEVYVPQAQFGPGSMTVSVRSRAGAAQLVPAIRREVHALDPNLPVENVETVRAAMRRETAPTRFYLFLVSLFAGLAVVLAAVGLYGVVAYLVSRRTREIGIRLALGARRWQVTGLVLRQGLGPALAGVVGGLLVALVGGRVMSSLLFEVKPMDPLVVSGTTALVLVVAVAAALLPARRATRVDPTEALRIE